jgi:CubicO group peptidase (beta-lactamase class C family)
LLPGCKSTGPDEISQKIQRIESEWAERLKSNRLLCVGVAVINDWKVEWARGYGAATKDTLFQAASISKPVTALAVMRLIEEGKLDLDQDVNQKLAGWKVAENEFTKKEKVTLRRLLSHSAGLTFPPWSRFWMGKSRLTAARCGWTWCRGASGVTPGEGTAWSSSCWST